LPPGLAFPDGDAAALFGSLAVVALARATSRCPPEAAAIAERGGVCFTVAHGEGRLGQPPSRVWLLAQPDNVTPAAAAQLQPI
jgi:hypothetical protein